MLIVSQDKKKIVFTDSGVTVYVDENFLMTTTLDGFNYKLGEYESEEEAKLALGYLAGKTLAKAAIAHIPKEGIYTGKTKEEK